MPGLETLLLIILASAFCTHLFLATRGWTQSLGGPHDFRQTQTAIATWYFIEDGPALDYKIPVLGPNWRLPHEFPLYQAIVASLVKTFGTPLEPTGRFVSLLCFYLCLPVLAGILRLLRYDRVVVYGVLLLTLSTSTYIFYSRTFLIESLALLLSLLFVWSAMRILQRDGTPKRSDFFIFIFGALAALVKVTTFSVSFGLVLLLVGVRLLETGAFWRDPVWRSKVYLLGGAIIVTLVAAFAWNQFILHSWSQSPQYANAHLGIHRWNFGELTQRNRPQFWGQMFSHVLEKPFGSILLALVSLTAFTFSPRAYRLRAFAFLCAWFSGFLVWANLHYVHDYYIYAGAVFFICWSVISLRGASVAHPFLRWPVGIVLAIFTVGQFAHYLDNLYFESQIHDWGREKRDFAVGLQDHVPTGEVLLILGDDWSPFIPYYAERLANMVRWPRFWAGKIYAESLALMAEEGRTFGGIVIRNTEEHLRDFQAMKAAFHLEVGESVYSSYETWVFYPLLSPFPR